MQAGYAVRRAETAADIEAVQRLRHICFRGSDAGLDQDAFDARCTHVMLEAEGALVGCFRLLLLPSGRSVGDSYSAQFYGLAGLQRYATPMAELGRFCIHPQAQGGADILRLAWGALAGFVEANGVRMLIGCSSFEGVDPGRYGDAFALLHARYLPPEAWRPTEKAPEVVRFAGRGAPELKPALAQMPPLLRSYLSMGGWVSDHAVIDRDLGTLHVFTGLEIGAMRPERLRALRALAGDPS